MTDVERHVALFNAAVAVGDFDAFAATFAEDATMSFVGVPAGPFRGRVAIAEAYRADPPGDAIDVVSVSPAADGGALVRFVWRSDPRRAVGEMRLSWNAAGKVKELVVTFAE